MATVPLRLGGLTPMHLVASALSAYPMGYLAVRVAKRGFDSLGAQGVMFLIASVGVAALPWMSRAIARRLFRAKCDDVAVYVRSEALPYRAITAVRIDKTARRHILVLTRGETLSMYLVLWDAFAGKLEPLDELKTRLAKHGHAL